MKRVYYLLLLAVTTLCSSTRVWMSSALPRWAGRRAGDISIMRSHIYVLLFRCEAGSRRRAFSFPLLVELPIARGSRELGLPYWFIIWPAFAQPGGARFYTLSFLFMLHSIPFSSGRPSVLPAHHALRARLTFCSFAARAESTSCRASQDRVTSRRVGHTFERATRGVRSAALTRAALGDMHAFCRCCPTFFVHEVLATLWRVPRGTVGSVQSGVLSGPLT